VNFFRQNFPDVPFSFADASPTKEDCSEKMQRSASGFVVWVLVGGSFLVYLFFVVFHRADVMIFLRHVRSFVRGS